MGSGLTPERMALMSDLCERIVTGGEPGPWEYYPVDPRPGVMGDVFRHRDADFLVSRKEVETLFRTTVSADVVYAFALQAIVPLPEPEPGEEWRKP